MGSFCKKCALIERAREYEDPVYLMPSTNRNNNHPLRATVEDICPPTSTPPAVQLSRAAEAPFGLATIMATRPLLPRDMRLAYTWSQRDKSPNITVQDPFHMLKTQCHRYPQPNSTDAIRSNTGVSSGLHVWEVNWPSSQRGSHAVVGVATMDAPLQVSGYHSLVGSDDQSWGWHLGRNKLYHNKKIFKGLKYTDHLNCGEKFNIPDIIYVVLHMDDGTLSFIANDQFLGVAFDGLKGKTLYPTVSVVWGHCDIMLNYVGGMHTGMPCSVTNLPRSEITRRLNNYHKQNRRTKKKLWFIRWYQLYLKN